MLFDDQLSDLVADGNRICGILLIDQQDFEFRLYAGDSRETVLGSVLVTRNGPSTPQQNVSSTPGEQTESPKSPH